MMECNIKKMELFTLVITKDNYLEFLDSKLSIYIRAGKTSDDYFLRRLKTLCKIVPEFTRQPILCRCDEMWRYDSEHYWEDNHGRCSLQFQNSYFGFSDEVNKFEVIRIDYKSFDIKQAGDKKIHRMAGVSLDYISPAQQKLIKEREREFRVSELMRQRDQLIAELETLEGE